MLPRKSRVESEIRFVLKVKTYSAEKAVPPQILPAYFAAKYSQDIVSKIENSFQTVFKHYLNNIYPGVELIVPSCVHRALERLPCLPRNCPITMT